MRSRPSPGRRQGGFTLIEAIVALVLVSGAGVALFSWVNQSLDTIHRVDEASLRARAKIAVAEYMQSVNPMVRPAGSVNLGAFGATWTSDPLADARDAIGYPRGVGFFQVQQFHTHVAVSLGGDDKWQTFDMLLTGYKKVREPGSIH